MSFSVTMVDGILRIAFADTLTNQDLAGLAREMPGIERALPVVPHRLTDVRAVTRLEITFAGVLKLVDERLRVKFPNTFKSAIVANDIAHYGFARMFQTLNDHPQISIAIFSDSADALSWLAMPGQEPPRHTWTPRAHAS